MPLIETRDLWKTYVMGAEEIHALRGVSLEIERGCDTTRTFSERP